MPGMLPSGRFWKLDDEGFILNDAAREKVRPRHGPVLAEVTGLYKRYLGSASGIYLRGTVARGMDIPGLSDLDDFALVPGEPPALEIPEKELASLRRDHPEVPGFGLAADSARDLGDGSRFSELALLMVTQTICLAGEDVIPSLPRYRPGVLVASNDVARIETDIEEALQDLETSPEDTGYWCRRVCKNIVRCGFSLTMLKTRRFTRDLYPCYAAFAEHHPGRADHMRRTVEMALSPTDDAEKLASHLRGFGGWMREEAGAWLAVHNPSGETEPPLEDFPDEVRFSPV